MSANLNKVLLAGRVSIPPQLKSSTGGITICHFNIAINRRYRSADGSQHEETDFMEISTFGKTADQCATYLKKGNPVFVEARLRQENWMDKNTGQNRSRLALVAERVHFLGGAPITETGQTVIDPEVRQALQPLPPPQYNPAVSTPPQASMPQMAAPLDTAQPEIQPIPATPDYGDVPF